MSSPPALSILVLTEDSARASHDTVVALTSAILREVDPRCDLDRVRFEPLEDELLRGIVHGNCWKSRQDDDRPIIRELIRRITSKLCERRPGFVVFHVDGDRKWAEHAISENRLRFRVLVRNRVRRLLQEQRWAKRVPGSRPGTNIDRLCLLMPFYSIEAWTYQNTIEARRILTEDHGGAYVYQFDEWARDRGLLDELLKPKETIPIVRDRYNRDLATKNYPTGAVCKVGKSFHHVVESMRRCAALVEALALTHPAGTTG